MTARLCDGERLVQLDQVEVGHLDAGAFEQLPHRRHRADPHHARVDPCHGGRDEARRAARRRARCRLLLARDHERGGAVVDPARVAGGDGAVLAERGLQRGQLLGVRVRPRMLVTLELADRDELVGEAPRRVRRRPAALRLERERVLVLARDPLAARRRSRRSRPSTRAGTSPPSSGSGSASRASCPRRSGSRAGSRAPACPSRAARASSTRRRPRRTGRRRRAITAWQAPTTADRPEAQSRLTVTPATDSRQPGEQRAPSARRCGCPRRPGSRSRARRPRSRPRARRRARPRPRSRAAARSSGRTPASPPP